MLYAGGIIAILRYVEAGSTILTVNEIYASIQGESSHAGRPCVFVRLTGCNLRCTWCDTEYAFYDGRRMTIDDVMRRIDTYRLPLVEITGGEPLLQPGCAILAELLLSKGKTVLVETSGALPINVLPPGTIRIMDIKCPGSGESEKMDWRNLQWLTSHDEVKFVVANRTDYEWSRDVIGRHDLTRICPVLISTAYGRLAPDEVAGWILADRLDVRFQLQWHKYIWDSGTRGV
ncbi:MAG: radical SAM protein [Candidatus Zixiibacteriota bacterium]